MEVGGIWSVSKEERKRCALLAIEVWKRWQVAKACVESQLVDEPHSDELDMHVYTAFYEIFRPENLYIIEQDEVLCQVTYWLQKAASLYFGNPRLYRGFVRRVLWYLSSRPLKTISALGKQEVSALARTTWSLEVDRNIRLRLLNDLLPEAIAGRCLQLADPRPTASSSMQPWTPRVPAKR